MKIRPEFESARVGLINRTPVPSLGVYLGELLCEEQRKTLVVLRWLMWPTILTANDDTNLRRSATVARKINPLLPFILLLVHLCACIFYSATVPGSLSNLTPEQVQQVIVSALSTLGFQGKTHLLPSPWLIDSAASNHMTGSLITLHDVHKYDGEQHIQIVDDNTLPITVVGNLGSSFTDVFVSPALTANLISVGQLVEENCSFHFDHNGCRVLDQASGQEIANWPKDAKLLYSGHKMLRTSRIKDG
ncbi:hypothetical protein LWI28_011709 [Acer negundo]|uniref:Retrovirus-related Pol polyprotein from transposon TNT 1-94-like beta-barrel domain-containing protein n=1 Tax=Acer negundo TaxID=4023 RepID=A0AAD5JAA7_ACENE|nr:hypothetical protein LWI28_011709 [Acer negundo]